MSDSSNPAATVARKVFIRTFGCQMNEYDSDKMADVLNAAEGYEPTDNPEEADLILFNTCSVREKAQEKVFSDLGRVKHLKEKGVLIGVGASVANLVGVGHDAVVGAGAVVVRDVRAGETVVTRDLTATGSQP